MPEDFDHALAETKHLIHEADINKVMTLAETKHLMYKAVTCINKVMTLLRPIKHLIYEADINKVMTLAETN